MCRNRPISAWDTSTMNYRTCLTINDIAVQAEMVAVEIFSIDVGNILWIFYDCLHHAEQGLKVIEVGGWALLNQVFDFQLGKIHSETKCYGNSRWMCVENMTLLQKWSSNYETQYPTSYLLYQKY